MLRRTLLTRVAVLDRHPAFRFGVDAFLKPECDLELVGAAADTRELWPMLQRVDPDVLLVDHEPDRPDRLALCLRIKARTRAKIVLCANEPRDDLAVLAGVAGADAIVDKSADPRELLDTLRKLAAGEPALPTPTLRQQARAGTLVAAEDRPVFAMRLAGTAPAEIAGVGGFPAAELEPRLAAILVSLAARDASPAARFTRAAA
jgi:DNA-binding NarL/FixJ family response regulator